MNPSALPASRDEDERRHLRVVPDPVPDPVAVAHPHDSGPGAVFGALLFGSGVALLVALGTGYWVVAVAS
jgi:hypothetical protein